MQKNPPMGSVEPSHQTHEQRDVQPRGFFIFFVSFLIGLALVSLAAWVALIWLATPPSPDEAMPLAVTRAIPPDPRLQGSPARPDLPDQDLRELQATQRAQLTSYGWVKRSEGIVHIPIDRAMDMVLQQGLPVAGQTTRPTTTTRNASPQGGEP